MRKMSNLDIFFQLRALESLYSSLTCLSCDFAFTTEHALLIHIGLKHRYLFLLQEAIAIAIVTAAQEDQRNFGWRGKATFAFGQHQTSDQEQGQPGFEGGCSGSGR